MTNYEKIKTLSIEEMAAFLYYSDCSKYANDPYNCYGWLHMEAE